MADQADTSIFGSQTPDADTNKGAQGGAPNANPDDLTTLLGTIKNERGEPKYKTVQEALKALQHSQEYIPTLKQTTAELEARLQEVSGKAAKVEQLEAAVLELTQRFSQGGSTNAPAITEEQIADLVNRTLTRTQQAAVAEQNAKTVVTKMSEAFGDKAEEVFIKKAKELGMSVAEFNAMASRTPQAVLQLVGAGTSRETTPLTSINTSGYQPKPDTKIKRNQTTALTGATTQDLINESRESRALVDELHAQGLTMHDLSDPKVYRKVFKK